MSISDQARELMTKERLKTEHSQDNMLERSEERLQEGMPEVLNEQAREILTQKRQSLEQTQDNMLERSEEEIH
jgi:hypothetical protein